MAMNLVCAVLDRGPADLAEMAVLLAIADSADRDTGEAWPAQKTIARRARQTDRSVRNVLARLQAAGWLTWEKRLRPNGSQASNVYTLDLEKLGETPRNAAPTPRNPVPPPPERGSAHAPERGSALEPSQKKETAREHATRPMRRPEKRPAAPRRQPKPPAPKVAQAATVERSPESKRPDPWTRAASAARAGLAWLHPETGRWCDPEQFAATGSYPNAGAGCEGG